MINLPAQSVTPDGHPSMAGLSAGPYYSLQNQCLLLVQGDEESLLAHSELFSRAGYLVAAVGTSNEIFGLRFMAVHLAVLDVSLGKADLRSAAESIRRQWPLARIIILGRVHSVLEDPLYDDAVDRRIAPEVLLATLRRLSDVSLGHAHEPSPPNVGNDDHERSPHSTPDAVESDPTKMPPDKSLENDEPEDLPADERRDWRPV